MKKIELAKKSRKLFSAILAGAMLTTSVIPESFVWAADVEEVQGFGDSESMGFGSTPDPVTEDGEEGFTDEIASFGSNGSDTPCRIWFPEPGVCRRTAGADQCPSNCGKI